MKENIVTLGSKKNIVGILAEPEKGSLTDTKPAVLLLNAGMIHRIGPNGIYVKIARNLASAGFLTLRFDFSGIGDSKVRDDNIPFEEYAVMETQNVMTYLNSKRGIDKFILVGICSGADVAFNTSYKDDRVVGIIPINGYLIEKEKLGSIHRIAKMRTNSRYYKKRLFSYKNWIRLITGKSNFRTIFDVLISKVHKRKNREQESITEKFSIDKWRALIDRNVHSFLIYSEGSTSLDIFDLTIGKDIRKMKRKGKLDLKIVYDSDHVFTLLWSQEYLMHLIYQWVSKKKWDKINKKQNVLR